MKTRFDRSEKNHDERTITIKIINKLAYTYIFLLYISKLSLFPSFLSYHPLTILQNDPYFLASSNQSTLPSFLPHSYFFIPLLPSVFCIFSINVFSLILLLFNPSFSTNLSYILACFLLLFFLLPLHAIR